MPAFKNLPAPAGYVDHYRFNTPLVVAGSVTFGLTYVASIVRGAQAGFKNGTGALAVPVIGPWLSLGARKIDCKVSVDTGTGGTGSIDDEIDDSTDEATKCFSKEAAAIAVVTGLGIGQLIGATLLAAGLLDRKHYYLRADLASISIEPTFDVNQLGFTLRGTL